MTDKLRVGDYMTGKVITVSPDDTVMDVIKLTRETGHDGFPVTRDGKVEGYISSLDMLLCESDELIKNVMSKNLIVAHPEHGDQRSGPGDFQAGRQQAAGRGR